tara:strand:- start:491 stop:628 length:138 start_codon:yes stop_codon:yes gene_type:complete
MKKQINNNIKIIENTQKFLLSFFEGETIIKNIVKDLDKVKEHLNK